MTKEIKIKIKDDKENLLSDAIAGLYPIPQVNNGTEDEPIWEPEFTESEWLGEYVHRNLKRQEARWRQMQETIAVTYCEDEELFE